MPRKYLIHAAPIGTILHAIDGPVLFPRMGKLGEVPEAREAADCERSASREQATAARTSGCRPDR